MTGRIERLITTVHALPVRLKVLSGLVLVILMSNAAFWPALTGGFIFDDYSNLVQETAWRVSSLAPSELKEAAQSGQASALGRPLAMLSFALNHALTGADPFWLKLTNLLLHATNAALAFLLLVRIVRALPQDKNNWIVRWHVEFALLVALLWAIHPLQVSSVMYVVQRMEVGAHTGALLALLAYVIARERSIDGRPAALWFAASGTALVFGLLFKETAVLAVGYAFLLEACIFRFRGRNDAPQRVLVATYAALICLGLMAYVAWAMPTYLSPDAYARRDFDVAERLWTQLNALRVYLGWILLPEPTRYVFFHDNFQIAKGLLSPPSTLLSAMVLAGLAGLAIASRRRLPLLALGIGWFFAAHALTSNIVPLELVFEHRNYFALLGIVMAATQALAFACARLNRDAGWSIALVALVATGLGGATHAHTWGDSFRLSVALATRNPDSPRASYDLGRHFLTASRMDPSSPAWDLAKKQFQHAADLPRSSIIMEQALLFMEAHSSTGNEATLWLSLREKLGRRKPAVEETSALHALSQCAIQQDCRLDLAELSQSLDQAIKQDPLSISLLMIRANLAQNAYNDTAAAIENVKAALAIDPEHRAAREALGKLQGVR